jgi:hypothetical protein
MGRTDVKRPGAVFPLYRRSGVPPCRRPRTVTHRRRRRRRLLSGRALAWPPESGPRAGTGSDPRADKILRNRPASGFQEKYVAQPIETIIILARGKKEKKNSICRWYIF